MGAMWFVRPMILNLAILKMDYNPNSLPMGVKALQLLCYRVKASLQLQQCLAVEWLNF